MGAELHTRLPAPIRRALHIARVYPEAWRVAADRSSRAALLRMLIKGNRIPEASPVAVRVRALGGEEIWLRPGTFDAEVAVATFAGKYHLPPALDEPLGVIWDLGSNIGLTMRHMASLYPEARLLGVELDQDNAELAKRNLAPVASRCTVVTGAVWSDPGNVRYSSADAPDGYHVQEKGDRTVEAVTMNELLETTGPPDYVKMDIEGGERVVLREATGWASAVKSVSVECHPPYSLAQCAQDLERMGFAVSTHPQTVWRRARDCAVGLRPHR